MNNIISSPYENINYEDISLGNPYSIDGTIVSDITLKNKNIYIQTPSCLTKEGIKEGNTSLKRKIYTELLFDKTNFDFINFLLPRG